MGGGGGLQNRRGAREVLPLRKGGRIFFSHGEVGRQFSHFYPPPPPPPTPRNLWSVTYYSQSRSVYERTRSLAATGPASSLIPLVCFTDPTRACDGLGWTCTYTPTHTLTTGLNIRDWSLIKGRGGGYKTGGGGHVKFYPCEKRGGGKSFSRTEVGAQNVLE